MTDAGWSNRLRRAWRRLDEAHDAVFVAPWRSGLRREVRRQEDTLLALVFLDSLGIENPAGYETLELYPYLVGDLHDWHRRQGMDTFPTPGVCC